MGKQENGEKSALIQAMLYQSNFPGIAHLNAQELPGLWHEFFLYNHKQGDTGSKKIKM
jgi:hypothetical protein